ncbi:UNVERIFIED_CONTAM: hypothetical protein NCL1_56966 [Trichonephila clavipes]
MYASSSSVNLTPSTHADTQADVRPRGGYHSVTREEMTDFVQSILGFRECAEKDVETWMACDAEDCGFQMLIEMLIVTSAARRIRSCRR